MYKHVAGLQRINVFNTLQRTGICVMRNRNDYLSIIILQCTLGLTLLRQIEALRGVTLKICSEIFPAKAKLCLRYLITKPVVYFWYILLQWLTFTKPFILKFCKFYSVDQEVYPVTIKAAESIFSVKNT